MDGATGMSVQFTTQEIDWLLYAVQKAIIDNQGMWDTTLPDGIKTKLNDLRHTCPFCGVSPTDGCPTCEAAGRIKTGETK
jgi:hypothetical protein